ncbi:MAG TPA: S8 family serine peptidase [Polyangiaceae bacterium]|nr:S8 family serine peptidase [Polyangiaceae bacterium]
MARILKVFAQGAEQNELSSYGDVFATYDAFAIVAPKHGYARALMRKFPAQDITSQYELSLRGRKVPLPSDARRRSRIAPRHRAPSRAKHHYLVQFAGPVKESWLRQIKKLGAEPRDLYRDFVYVVRADERTAQRVLELPFVLWVGHLPHEDRLSPGLKGESEPKVPRTRLRTGVYTVQVFDKRLVASVSSAAKRLGFSVITKAARGRSFVIQSRDDLAKRTRMLRTLATVHGVRFIRARPIRRTSNDVASRLMGTKRVGRDNQSGLSGRGEIIAICDTGLDTGDAATIHADFKGRIVAIKSYPVSDEFRGDAANVGADDGPADFDSGHGTHVAGSVLGDGAQSGFQKRPIRGLAHRAKLVFQAVEQEMKWRPHVAPSDRERYLLAGIPPNIEELFAYAYRKGARVHSNSWGGGDPGDYDEQCEQLDRFIWKHQDFTVMVAAGNDGTDSDADGRINLRSVTPPATAKNCITVGASENSRPDLNVETYGGWWPRDYPANPLRDDPMADNPNQVAAFSSRGPTRDGRVKPDVVAPGTFILSTRSTMIAENNVAWRKFRDSNYYFFMGGTSMATPLAAGAAALVREYLRTRQGVKRPSAALVKATLIAGAKRLPSLEVSTGVADNHQGYGRIDLDAVLTARTHFVDVSRGLKTGQRYSLRLSVRAGSPALRVALAYSDYPGPSLVNDLNLILTGPSGRKFTTAGLSVHGEIVLDTKNNTELVLVESPQRGAWALDVVASNVPQGPQRFALVILGATGRGGCSPRRVRPRRRAAIAVRARSR